MQQCLEILERGNLDELYGILPKIQVLRAKRFLPLLLALLHRKDREKQEFAIHALGALEKTEVLPELYRLLKRPGTQKGKGTQQLQAAIIAAMGELGSDNAVRYFREFFYGPAEKDPFTTRRRRLILESLGVIAQQGGAEALRALVELLNYPDEEIRATAVAEIAVAFWHRPEELPEPIFQKLASLVRDRDAEVRNAVLEALEGLAGLGSEKCEKFLREYERKD
ncbi:MAG: HEAT repeat domain-containing protein [Acidobacteria bacterium]|nr:HEAT repeat domain-containing protein [Acidobacteriota bacterium]